MMIAKSGQTKKLIAAALMKMLYYHLKIAWKMMKMMIVDVGAVEFKKFVAGSIDDPAFNFQRKLQKPNLCFFYFFLSKTASTKNFKNTAKAI